MLKVTLKLDPTLIVHKIKTFGILTLFENIGGLAVFICIIATPIVSCCVGNRYLNSLLKQLYWVNDSPSETNEKEQQISPLEYAKKWSKMTERFTITRKNACL
jgi:hypothetical protein